MTAQSTPTETRIKIKRHLEKGAGIYAYHPTEMGCRYFDARVTDDVLQVWDGFSWFDVPRGTQFNNGHGSAGNLFVY